MLKSISLRQFQIIALALVAVIVSLSTWTFTHASGTTISICVKHTGDSYVIGSGFDHSSCKNNEQLLSFNVTGPQGPAGTPACSGACAQTLSVNKALYAPGETIEVTCSMPSRDFKLYDITNGGDNGSVYLGLFSCTDNASLSFESQSGHTYGILQFTPANPYPCSDQYYTSCAQYAESQVIFSVQ